MSKDMGVREATEQFYDEAKRNKKLVEEYQARIAELEAERKRLFEDKSRLMDCYFEFETVAPDGDLKISVLDLYNELVETREKAKRAEQMAEKLIEAGNSVIAQAFAEEGNVSYSNAHNLNAVISEWQERKQ